MYLANAACQNFVLKATIKITSTFLLSMDNSYHGQ